MRMCHSSYSCVALDEVIINEFLPSTNVHSLSGTGLNVGAALVGKNKILPAALILVREPNNINNNNDNNKNKQRASSCD